MATKAQKGLSDNNYIALVVVVTVLILLGCGWLGKSLGTKLLHNNRVLIKQRAAVAQLDTDITNAPRLVSAYNALGPTQTLLADALPDGPDASGFINLMEGMGAQSGVTVKTITPLTGQDTAEPSNNDAATTAQFTVALTSNYANLAAFIKTVELSARPMHITNITLSGSGTSLSSTIDITTYYAPGATLELGKEAVK